MASYWAHSNCGRSEQDGFMRATSKAGMAISVFRGASACEDL